MAFARSLLIAGSMAVMAAGGYLMGMATAPTPAGAQGDGPVIDLDMFEQIAVLEARVDALEGLRGTVTAPFRVLDQNGMALATIMRGEGGLPEFKLGDGIVLGYAEGEPRVSIHNGSRIAGMHLLDNGATLYASPDGTDGFFAGTSATNGNGARIFQGGERVADLGAPPGRGAGVRFFTGGTLIAGLGISTAGNGLLHTAQSDGSVAVTVGGTGEGHAAVDVFHGSVQAASVNTRDLAGGGLVVVRNGSGSAVAYLSQSAAGAGGSVSVTDPGGNEVFGAGFDGTAGAACVRRPNGNQFCLEPTLPLSRQQ